MARQDGRACGPPGRVRVDDNGWVIGTDDEAEAASGFGWWEILARWVLIEAGFQAHHHIDLTEPSILDGKTWRWFCVRLFGLPKEARLWEALRTDPEADDSTDSLDAALGISRE